MDDNKIEQNYSLDYLIGIFKVFAHINEPNSTLQYDYEIFVLEKNSDLISQLKSEFDFFKNQDIELKKIDTNILKETLRNWFYKNGEIRNLNISETKQEFYSNFYCDQIIQILKVKNIFCITNLKSENENVYLELGVFYDFIFLEGEEKNYMIYFSYVD